MEMKRKTLVVLAILFLTALPSYVFAQMGGGGMMAQALAWGKEWGAMVKVTGRATARARGKANPLRISHQKNRKRGLRLLLMNICGVIFRSTSWKRRTTRKISDPFLLELNGVLVIAGIVLLVRYLSPHSRSKSSEDALEILKRRYARGEIQKAEFEETRKDLES